MLHVLMYETICIVVPHHLQIRQSNPEIAARRDSRSFPRVSTPWVRVGHACLYSALTTGSHHCLSGQVFCFDRSLKLSFFH